MIKVKVIEAKPKKGFDLETPLYNIVAKTMGEKIAEDVANRSCEKEGHESHYNEITITSHNNQNPDAKWTSFCCADFRDTVVVNFK